MPRHAVRTLALAATVIAVAAAAPAPPAAAQELPPPALVLGEGRFAVTATFHAPGGEPQPALPIPLTRDTGTFWFFDRENLELVVKVLEACPVNQRNWVFAAGLTNVGVELTVEDRLAGVTWSRSHQAGPPFPPILDTAALATCALAPSCGRGTAAEIAATPRADEEAERLALFLGGELTAPQPLYERVRDDLAALRGAHPSLAGVPFVPRHDTRTLILTVPPAVHDAIAAGTYDEWSCLNDWYGAVEARTLTLRVALVRFAGRLDTERIAAEYAQLAGIETASPDALVLAHPRPLLCAIGHGETIHYFARTDSFLHFTSRPGHSPQPAGSWSPALPVPEPPWFDLLEQCFDLYVAECCALS